ncbi:unnamed protein product [Alopecurus aequalis]
MAKLAAALTVLALVACVAPPCQAGYGYPYPMPSTPNTPSPPPPTPVTPASPPPHTPGRGRGRRSPPPPAPITPSSPPPYTPGTPSPPPPAPITPSSPPPYTPGTPSPPPPAPITPSSPPPPYTPGTPSAPPPTPTAQSSPPPPSSTPSPPPPTPSTPAPGLAVGYYQKTCARAETIVREVVGGYNRGIMAGLIRLFFHDCFVRGCDASVLLDDPNSQTEKFGIPNLSLRGFEAIDAAKARIIQECGNVVSCADIVAFAGRDATYFLSNQNVDFDMPAGRLDGLVSLESETIPNLPPPFATVDELKANFASKGLSVDEMVTLSGAHTIGRSHCSSFSGRLTDSGSDMDPTLKSTLLTECQSSSGADNTVVQDRNTPSVLDNQYYKNVLRHQVLFDSDATLLEANDTSDAVSANAQDTNQWQEKFKAAMVKMGANIDANAKGEIRMNCRVLNA